MWNNFDDFKATLIFIYLFFFECPLKCYTWDLHDFKANYVVPNVSCNNQCWCDTSLQGCVRDASVQEVCCAQHVHAQRYDPLGLGMIFRLDVHTCVRVCLCVRVISSVHERLMASGGLPIKRLPLSKFLMHQLHPCLFITVMLSRPLAELQLTRSHRAPSLSPSAPPAPSSIHPSFLPPLSSPLLSSARLFLLPPAPAGLADQEPGLPWQLVLSLSRGGSPPDCICPTRQI